MCILREKYKSRHSDYFIDIQIHAIKSFYTDYLLQLETNICESWGRPLLGPSPVWKRILALSYSLWSLCRLPNFTFTVFRPKVRLFTALLLILICLMRCHNSIYHLHNLHKSFLIFHFFRRKMRFVTYLALVPIWMTSWKMTVILCPPVIPCFPHQLHQHCPLHHHHSTHQMRTSRQSP